MSTEMPEQATAQEFISMPAEEVAAYLHSRQEPPALSEAQIASLPSSQIEPYLMARVTAGDAGAFERFKQYMFAGRDAREIIEKRVHESESAGVEYMDGLPASDRDYLGEDHTALKSYVDSITTENITYYSDGFHDASQLFREVADELKTSMAKLQHEWEGAAADNAHGFFTTMSTWADGNSHNAQLASDIVYQESEAASQAKNSMPEPVPFSWDEELKKWGGNPFDFGDNIKQSFEKFDQSRQAHEEAARVMNTYDGGLHDTGNKQPVFAEPPSFGTGGSDSSRMPSGTFSLPGHGDGTSASGFSGGIGSSGGVPGGGGGWTPPPGPASGGGGYAPVPLPAGRGTGANPNGTGPSGYRPPSIPRSRMPSNSGNPNPVPGMGPMPMGGGFGPGGGGGGGYSSGVGRGAAGGFGPGGGAGAGAASGAGRPGMPGGMPPGAAPGGAGAAAAAGRGGMGAAGMGAGAGRGKGEDDAEHQRPTYLVEADPDDVFGTNQRTAPPVIGE